MKLFLLNFVKSKTFKAVLALLAAAATAYATQGCALLSGGPKNARVAKFDCQVEALRPVFGDVLDAADLLRSLYSGSADLDAALTAAGATQDEVRALIDALQACDAPPPVVPATELAPS